MYVFLKNIHLKRCGVIICGIIFFLAFVTSCKNFQTQKEPAEKIPVIYSDKYIIDFLGLENLHPYDTHKPKKIHKFLKKTFGLSDDQFFIPEKITDEEILTVHTQNYLQSLNHSEVIAEIAETPRLKYIPAFLLKKHLLEPMKYATGGTVLGTAVALKYGFAVNLSGGYHHAKSSSGEGFCFFADINLAVNILQEEFKREKILIVDLDAHQGNGYESILKNDTSVDIFDVYNAEVFPDDQIAKKYIDYEFPLLNYTKDSTYLNILINGLPEAVRKSDPDFIIYNAGTDIFEDDNLGKLSISEDAVIERDEIVFKIALKNKIPVLMLLSGGYTKKSSEIVSRSVTNILNKFYFHSN